MSADEAPQAGRYRQFHQVGIEAIGIDDPALDAEVIAVGDAGFRALGLTGYRLELTSLGDANCRPAYRSLLQEFLSGLPLDEATRQRAELNPLRVLDSKRREDAPVIAAAPSIDQFWSDAAAEHFATVQAGLSDLGIPFRRELKLVRGLDYYRRTTFEFQGGTLDSAQNALGGGGRYDGLVEDLGGPSTPGIGFALGVDRTLLACSDV